jgi:hypothetical protein
VAIKTDPLFSDSLFGPQLNRVIAKSIPKLKSIRKKTSIIRKGLEVVPVLSNSWISNH